MVGHVRNKTQDQWVDPPQWWSTEKHQTWFQIRYATARYFGSAKSFNEGFVQSQQFNIMPVLYDDLNTTPIWDISGAKVGITRVRASDWERTFQKVQ